MPTCTTETRQGTVVEVGIAQETDTALPITPVKRPSEERIEALIDLRATARKSKNFAEADRIREELADQGIVLEDKPGGKTVWRHG